jgi:hypothetical protein
MAIVHVFAEMMTVNALVYIIIISSSSSSSSSISQDKQDVAYSWEIRNGYSNKTWMEPPTRETDRCAWDENFKNGILK